MFQWLTAAVADMQYVNRLALNRKKNPVHVRCFAIEQMANLQREPRALCSYWAAFWQFGKRCNRILQG